MQRIDLKITPVVDGQYVAAERIVPFDVPYSPDPEWERVVHRTEAQLRQAQGELADAKADRARAIAELSMLQRKHRPWYRKLLGLA